MNFKRAEAAKRQAENCGYAKIGVLVIEKQIPAVIKMIGKDFAEIYFTTADYLTKYLNLKLFEPFTVAYQLPDGRYVIAKDIPQRQRAASGRRKSNEIIGGKNSLYRANVQKKRQKFSYSDN